MVNPESGAHQSIRQPHDHVDEHHDGQAGIQRRSITALDDLDQSRQRGAIEAEQSCSPSKAPAHAQDRHFIACQALAGISA